MALNGSLSNGVCFATVADARDNFYSSFGLQLSGTATINYEMVGFNWNRCSTTAAVPPKIGVKTCAPVPLQTFPVCDPIAPFSDGVLLGLALAGAMVITSISGLISRAK